LDKFFAGQRGDVQEVLRLAREDGRDEPWGYGAISHALSALRVNRPREAIEALKGYDPYHPDLEWRRLEAVDYWWVIARAHHLLGEHEVELELIRKAAEQKQAPYQAEQKVLALAALGRFEEVERVLDEALTEDWGGAVARAAGRELIVHGHPAEGRAAFERAVTWYEDRPSSESGRMQQQHYLGEALYGAGRWEEAGAVFRALLAEYPESLILREGGTPEGSTVLALGWVGRCAARVGDTATALEIDSRIAGMKGSGSGSRVPYERAKLAAVLGRPDEAVRLLREAVSRGVPVTAWQALVVHQEIELVSLHGREDYQQLMRPKG